MEQIRSTAGKPEYAVAFRSIKSAKNFASMLIILALLLQIGGVVVVHFVRLLDEPVAGEPVIQKAEAAQPAGKPTAKVVSKAVATAAEAPDAKVENKAAVETAAKTPAAGTTKYSWDDLDLTAPGISRLVLKYGLPASRFAVLVLGLMLVLMVMFAVKLSLVERVGGVAGFMSAFNWSLILLMMLIPWRPILGSSMSCGALFTFSELMKADAALGQTPVLLDQIIFYARFLGYPGFALLVCLIVQSKFSRGFAVAKFKANEAEAVASRIGRQE
jgi:hypothetical protein